MSGKRSKPTSPSACYFSSFLALTCFLRYIIFNIFSSLWHLLLTIGDYLFHSFLLRQTTTFGWLIQLMLNLIMMPTTQEICVPCLLIHTQLYQIRKVFILWSWGSLIFYLIWGKLHISSLLSFITSVNYESNLRLSSIFASSWHFAHSFTVGMT